MEPMFLDSVENATPGGLYADAIRGIRSAGMPVPQIMHLFAYKPDWTEHLARYAQAVMRGDSPLSPVLRELIAAYTSKLNHCPF